MTEQSILVYKLFLSDFSLFFVEKLQPPEKSRLPLSQQPCSKNCGGWFNAPPPPLPPSRKWRGGGGAHYHQKP